MKRAQPCFSGVEVRLGDEEMNALAGSVSIEIDDEISFHSPPTKRDRLNADNSFSSIPKKVNSHRFCKTRSMDEEFTSPIAQFFPKLRKLRYPTRATRILPSPGNSNRNVGLRSQMHQRHPPPPLLQPPSTTIPSSSTTYPSFSEYSSQERPSVPQKSMSPIRHKHNNQGQFTNEITDQGGQGTHGCFVEGELLDIVNDICSVEEGTIISPMDDAYDCDSFFDDTFSI